MRNFSHLVQLGCFGRALRRRKLDSWDSVLGPSIPQTPPPHRPRSTPPPPRRRSPDEVPPDLPPRGALLPATSPTQRPAPTPHSSPRTPIPRNGGLLPFPHCGVPTLPTAPLHSPLSPQSQLQVTRWPCLEMPPHTPFPHCYLSRPRVKDDMDRGADNPHGETEFTHERIRDTSVFSVLSICWLCHPHYGWFNQLGPRHGCGRWSATR